ncbi:unnamed protein product [Urochloa humidicola]
MRRSRSPASSEEPGPLAPSLQLEIAMEVVSRLNSLVKFLEDRVPGLRVSGSGASRAPPKAASSGRARVPAKASRAVATSSSPAATLRRPGHVAMPAVADVTVGLQVVSGYSGEEDANATSAVPNNISEDNVSHEHHAGQELPSEHESLSSIPSTKGPLSPALQLEIAKEVITRLTMSQEMGMLSADEHSLIKFMKDGISGLGAEAASGMCGSGATSTPLNVAPSVPALAPAKADHPIAASLSPVPTPLHAPSQSHQVATPAAAHVTVGEQAVTRHLGKEDANATSCVHNNMSEANASHKHHVGIELPSEHESFSSSPSSSSKEPLTPEIQLEVAKELISQLLKAQEKRMLSAAEHSLIKSLEDGIPRLEATLGVRGGETQSLSKVASSCLARAKARHVIMATFSAVDQGRPVPFVPMVYPLSQQDAKVARHSGEEDAHTTSAVHKMSDANVSHEHHRGGQELSSEHESFFKNLNSGCVLGVVTEKSSTTTAPEMAPPPSDGDNTAESSGVSNCWGTAPDAEGFDDFGLPDDLGLY